MNLAGVYRDAGMTEVSLREGRAVTTITPTTRRTFHFRQF
jgi:hypothetical protein